MKAPNGVDLLNNGSINAKKITSLTFFNYWPTIIAFYTVYFWAKTLLDKNHDLESLLTLFA